MRASSTSFVHFIGLLCPIYIQNAFQTHWKPTEGMKNVKTHGSTSGVTYCEKSSVFQREVENVKIQALISADTHFLLCVCACERVEAKGKDE